MRLMLAGMGIDSAAVRVADGSGVSRYNLTSASALIRLLEGMHADSVLFRPFYHSLPIAGVDGTIGRRMRGSAADGNLRAKTGTLSGVTSLSGYVRTAEGELLAFSMLMQDFASGGDGYRAIQNRIGALLASLRRSTL
jgi:D-alanyl-D-alanine carboxypeptidase/D-alanyl-D-alanine-endopeptidase (penicillin-binding protein 4)